MHRPAYFAPGEDVIVDSPKCPDMNGPGVIINRMWIAGRKGAADGWVYQMMGRDTGRWLMERSLKKDLKGCGVSFDAMLAGLNGACIPLSLKAQETMDSIMRRKTGEQPDGQA